MWRDTVTKTRERFNPRAPCGARRDFQLFMKRLRKISTHAPLAGRDEQRGIQPKAGEISTHAPLAGRDSRIYAPSQCVRYFNPRAPCGARRLLGWVSSWTSTFRSTRPLRGATIAPVATSESIEISTHAPLAGRDDIKVSGAAGKGYFNPRAPCGARRY